MPVYLDLCLYNDDDKTPVYPPDDLEDGRVKSLEEDLCEWRLATVESCHVLMTDETKLVKGYGRVTVSKKYPDDEFYEFAYWNVPHCYPDQPESQPEWEYADVHYQHVWQNFF